MHRYQARVLGALALFSLVGCTAASAPTDGGAADDPLADLDRDTGQMWTVRYHSDLHTPAYLVGRTPPLAATPADAERAGRAFLTRYAALYQMSAPDDELETVDSVTDELGMTHARYSQRQGSLPVWGGELVVHFASDGALVTINGRYQPLPAMPSAPARSSDDARVAAVTDARAARPEVDPNDFTTLAPKLYIFPVSASSAKLAWRVETEVNDLAQPARFETFIDAADGSILHRSDILAHVEGSGTGVLGDHENFPVVERNGSYWLEDATHGSPPQKIYSAADRTKLPGTEVSSKTLDHWDESGSAPGAAVDAAVFVATAYDYYAKVHGRSGWDGKGKGVHASVHYGQRYANAYFDGSRLVFGDGDGTSFLPLSGALDVVAHEFTHGVTAQTAKLGGEGQSGALNEAVSDIFATFIGHHAKYGHDWKMGSAVYRSRGKATPLRDAVSPHSTGNPANMDEYVDTSDDNGGVHENCTIVSHAAYLMTAGAKGLSLDATAKIWYRALTRYLTSRATFADAADATLAAARDLGASQEAQVRAAWVAVGLGSE